jgi:hypothetical protein
MRSSFLNVSISALRIPSSRNLNCDLVDHGEKLADIPDEYLNDTLPIAKKIAIAQGVNDYNILQNNGALAHQVMASFISWGYIIHRRVKLGSKSRPLPCHSQTIRRRRTWRRLETPDYDKARFANSF